MRLEAGRKKWIGLMLAIILCLTGVYAAGVTEDIPAYTSFSHVSEIVWEPDCTAAQSVVQPAAAVPVQRFYQNSSLRLPDVVQPTERIQQDRGSLIRQGRPERRSSHRYVEEAAGRTEEGSWQAAGICYSRESIETTVFLCRSRIISYTHNQDGQKDNIL